MRRLFRVLGDQGAFASVCVNSAGRIPGRASVYHPNLKRHLQQVRGSSGQPSLPLESLLGPVKAVCKHSLVVRGSEREDGGKRG